MSIGYTFVKINNIWYREASIVDPQREYFICFDEDEPPELVIKGKKTKKDAIEILKQFANHFMILIKPRRSYRIFGKAMKFHLATAFFFYPNTITAPAQYIESQKAYKEHPTGEGTYYDFEQFNTARAYYSQHNWKEIKT